MASFLIFGVQLLRSLLRSYKTTCLSEDEEFGERRIGLMHTSHFWAKLERTDVAHNLR